MLRKRKERKRKTIAETLMRDIQGSPADKLAMLERMNAAGGFANADPAELKAAEDMLRTFAAAERRRRPCGFAAGELREGADSRLRVGIDLGPVAR